jgi:hypothetical protein
MGGLSFAPAMAPLRPFLVLAPLPPPFADKRQRGWKAVGFRAKSGKLAFLIALWHNWRSRSDECRESSLSRKRRPCLRVECGS